jgi:exonuclease V gamma subunit
MNPMQMLQQFRANPMQFFMQRRLNVPANMMNDPNAILNHLLQSGQISQQQINAAYQQMGQFRNK